MSFGPPIETLEDWNERLLMCGCCEMPSCPVPAIDQQYRTATKTVYQLVPTGTGGSGILWGSFYPIQVAGTPVDDDFVTQYYRKRTFTDGGTDTGVRPFTYTCTPTSTKNDQLDEEYVLSEAAAWADLYNLALTGLGAWLAGTPAGHPRSRFVTDWITNATLRDNYMGGTYTPSPGDVTNRDEGSITLTESRFRWQIPDTFEGSYFKVTWDEVWYPKGFIFPSWPTNGDPVMVNQDQFVEWTGPGDPEDPESWYTDWRVLPIPDITYADQGEIRIRNVRYECTSGSRYGSKPELYSGFTTNPPPP